MMQTILEHVVSQGLGRKAAPLSKAFKVAGKTGTAQIADEHGGYHSGTTRYWLSFAGFFPADNPKYTILVTVYSYLSGRSFYGGTMPALAVRDIVDKIYALDPDWRPEIHPTAAVPDFSQPRPEPQETQEP